MASDVNSANVLRNLAKDLLNQEENEEFKSALQTYHTTSSITGLVANLTTVVTTTEKLMLLVELSNCLSESLRPDFHKLCCLHFPKYDSFLTYFTPNMIGGRNTTISKDSTGQFQVVTTGLDANFFASTDQRSLQGESGIDVNSDVADISRHGGDANNNGYLGNSWKIESRSYRGSVSSHAGHSAASAPTPKGSISSAKQIQQSWKQSHASLPSDQGGKIRNRARSLRVLSGSLPSVLAMHGTNSARGEDRLRILLKRREDGSLGLGVRGGKEYNSPIEVYQVEPGSQGEMQGLRVGDRILDVNGTDFSNITHAEAVMMMRNAWNIIMVVQHPRDDGCYYGDAVDGGISSISIDDWEVSVYPTKKGKLGCGVHRDKFNYLVVKNVERNSPASKAGLCKGDRFLQIENIPVSSMTDKQVATLTNAKRVRINVLRPAASVSTRAPSDNVEFNNMFSPMALDLSKLDGNDVSLKRDDDQATFASSTPRRAARSHSEERHVVHAEVHPKPRSASQTPELTKHHKNRPLPPTPSPQHATNNSPIEQDHHIMQKNIETSSNYRKDISNNDNFILTPKGISPKQQKQQLQQQQQQQLQRLYRPRVIVSTRQSSNSYSPSIQHHQHLSNQSSKHLGRYISHNHHGQTALPSRMAMVYSTKPRHDFEHDRSRPKKRTSATASSKMKVIRNRSQSPHHVIPHSAHETFRTGSMPPQRDKEFLKAIQNSVERRQRAHRLSLYQLPDQDDDTWRFD